MPVGEIPSAIVAANLAACANLDETDATALLRFVDLPLYCSPLHLLNEFAGLYCRYSYESSIQHSQ